MTTTEIIHVEKLVKSYENRVIVDHLDIKIQQGQVYGFLGPNGSGKTTTIRMLCGLVQPDGGNGHCLGFDLLSQSHEIKQRIGYMPQLFSYYKELSVRENLMFLARLHQLEKPVERITEVTEQLGLSPYLNHDAGKLSGGWKQLLSFAGSMLHNPKVLLLDEPTAGLDVHARSKFWNHLYSLTQLGLTVLVSTHYMDEAERCTNLAYLLNGKLYEIGSAKELTDSTKLYSWHLNHIFDETDRQAFNTLPFTCCINTFGGATTITAANQQALKTCIEKLQKQHPNISCKTIPASTEDTFLFFIKNLKDKNEKVS